MIQITHRLQPSHMSCGQTVLAMLLDVPPSAIITMMGNRGTCGRQLAEILNHNYFTCDPRPRRYRGELPNTAIVRVEVEPPRRVTHWVLWAHGRFWDPNLLPTLNDHDPRLRGYRIYSFMAVGLQK